MTTIDILLTLTIGACAVALFAAGHSWALIRELNRLRETEPKIKVGGSSDVDKSEGWMPFD